MKGIIYKIVGYGLTYYGSTTQNLDERKYNHKSQFKNRDKGRNYCSSWIIFEKGDDWIMTQLEEIEFEDIDELRLKEAYYQKNNECVNICKLKTKDEMKEYKKEWAEKSRRAKGQQIKAEMTKTKEVGYNAKMKRERMARMTPEQKAAHLEHRRATRKPLTEEQKEQARERARKQREKKKLNI